MDMEVNLLLGGPDHRSPLTAVQDDPAVRTLRAVANARRTLQAGFTTVRNLGLFIQTGGLLLDVALKKAIDLGWIDGPAHRPGRPRHLPHRRPSRPHHVPGLRPARPAPHRRRGHRQRGQRSPQGGALPDQVRRQGHQGLRLGRRDVAHRARPAPSSTPTRSCGPSSTKRTGPDSRSPPTPTATTASAPPSKRASTASSTGRS